MKKGKRKNKKNRGLFLVVLAVLVVGIGFAALQKYLTIDGTASINSNFDVRFSYIKTGDIVGGAYNKSEPTFTENTATFDAAFLAPGDSITYNIYVVNEGTMNAKLENIDVNIDDNENISYEITGIKVGDIIESRPFSDLTMGDIGSPNPTERWFSLKLTYNGDGSEATTSNVKVTMKFIQTNEQTNTQVSSISLIENEKPTVSYHFAKLKTPDANGSSQGEFYFDWNSANAEQLSTYFIGTEVYQQYDGGNWQMVKQASDEVLTTYGSNSLKLRNVYAINGVKYYSQYSDEFNIHFYVQDGFVYYANDLNTIIGTDDSHFIYGEMTLPAGKKFLKMTSNNIPKVRLPEDYNLSDLAQNSLPTKLYYGTALETIVNKTGKAIDWAPIVGYYSSANGVPQKCEFITGTCAGVNIVAED